MGPISEAGFQPGWFQRGRARPKRHGGDIDPLPWKTYSLIAMLERRLHRQNSFRQVYRKNGRKVIRLVPPAATPASV
jgi:hypothetical protein